MDLEEIGINAGNWVDSAQNRNYWSPCECDIEPPGSKAMKLISQFNVSDNSSCIVLVPEVK